MGNNNIKCNEKEELFLKNPCVKKEMRLKKCLKENNQDIKLCQQERLFYELCLIKNKKYKTILKD